MQSDTVHPGAAAHVPRLVAALWLGLGLGLGVLTGCHRDPHTTAAAADAAAPEEERVLNVVSWPGYIAPETVPQFERESGIRVNYTTIDSDEGLETKLLIGNSGFDVVLPSGPFFARQLKAGVYRKLDKSALTHYANLDPQVLAYMAEYDPENRFAVPYLRTSVGLFYDVDKIRARIGGAVPDSWALLFDPNVAGKLADCGIGFAGAPTQVFGAVLQYLGEDPRSMTPAKVEQLASILRRVRPYVSHNPQAFVLHMEDLASGDFCAALTWGGDAELAREDAERTGRPVHFAFITPREGGQRWIDMMAIPADAPHPRNALRWMNYLMQPKVIAQISEYVRYANGNAASMPLLSEGLKRNPSIYPDAATQARLVNAVSPSTELTLMVNRAWADLRNAR